MKIVKLFFLVCCLAFSSQTQAISVDDLTSFTMDSMITLNLRAQLLNNPLLSKYNISLSTNAGIVSIDAMIDSIRSAGYLIQTVAACSGVRNIDTTKLKVADAKKSLNDVIITAEIRGLLLRSQLFGNLSIADMPIAVHTEKGTVILKQKNPLHEKEMDAVVKMASAIKGVRVVDTVDDSEG